MSKSAGISAIGYHLPSKIVSNSDLEKMVNTSDEWIKSRTGIKERRVVADNENCSDIAVEACKKVLNRAQLNPEDIDLILFTSLSPDMLCPSTASIVQGKLELVNAAAFDVSAACAGFTFALTTAESFIKSDKYKNILVVGAEAISRLINWNDKNTCILFGDGAGAALVQPAEHPYGILESYLENDGNKSHYIEIPAGASAQPASENTIKNNEHFLKMKGQEVFKFAVRVIPHAINKVLSKSDIKLEDVNLFIPHQANLRIIEAAAKKLNINKDKFFTNMENLGNTSTASVPIALEQAIQDGRLKKGDIVVIVGFGAGLSLGANLIRWSY